MSSLNKVICFFTTKYYNNLKYSNRILSTTRIFFERTTKFTQTLSSLGNVYRSSKWSDLSAQNIKFSSLRQYASAILGFILTILVLFLMVRSYNFSLKDILFLFTNILYTIQDVLYYLILIMLSFINFIFLKLSFLIKKIVPLPFHKGVPTSPTPSASVGSTYKPGSRGVPLSDLKFSNKGLPNLWQDDIILSTLFLQKSLLLLPKLDYQMPPLLTSRRDYVVSLNLSNNDPVNKEIPLILYNNSRNEFLLKKQSRGFGMLQSESKLLSFYKNKEFSIMSTLSPNYLTFSNLDFMDYKSIISNVNNNLVLAKQSR